MGIFQRFRKKVDEPVSEKEVFVPLNGTIIALDQVNDPLFADHVLGDGIAIEPSDGVLVSPVDGEITMLFDSKHAILIKSKDGVKIFIHIGIDTVALGGRYFRSLCKLGDRVTKGDKIMEFDCDMIRKEGYELTTPIIISNYNDYEEIEVVAKEQVSRLDLLMKMK
ncbi:PTS system, beta-glucoside-specific IIB component [Lachnospiraceae bacterium KM106-2]|nr:PTS system, beta-glucoside-specific IIB component [Lachnospiraceae bacterium KM106-2]